MQANRVLASLSGFFAWAIGRGQLDINPVLAVPKNSEEARERVLSDAEIRTIWSGTSSGSDYDRIIRVLLLTGTRRSEVGSMCWEELSKDLWTIPAIRMKNSEDHEVWLTELALAQLPSGARAFRSCSARPKDSGYSGWSRSKARLDRRLKLPAWSLHDFRRTLSTRLHDASVAPHIVEGVLAHVGHKQGVSGVYNLANYREQKREALELWAQNDSANFGVQIIRIGTSPRQ